MEEVVEVSLSEEEEALPKSKSSKLPLFTDPSDSEFVREWSQFGFSKQALDDRQNPSIRSISIDITNGLKGTEGLMVTNFRVLCVVLFYVALTLPGFISFEPWAMIPSIVVSICIAVPVIWSTVREENTLKKEGKSDKDSKTLRYRFTVDRIFHVNCDDKELKVPKWFCCYFVACSVWVMIAISLAQSKYDNKRWVTRCYEGGKLDSDDVKNGSCLVRTSTWTVFFWYLGYFGGVSLGLIQRPIEKTKAMVANVKKSLRDSFPTAASKIAAIDKKIAKKNVKISDRMLRLSFLPRPWADKDIPYTYVVFFTICALGIVLSPMYVGHKKAFWKVDEPSHTVDSFVHYAYFIYFMNIPWSVFLIYRTFEVLWNMTFLFEADRIAMNALSGPIYCTKIQDIKCWYRMRQFYLLYKQPLQSGGFASILFAIVLFISVGMSGYIAIRVRIIDDNLTYFNSADAFISSCGLCMLAYFLLRYLNAAVSVYNAQVSHIKLLKSEILRLQLISNSIDRQLADSSQAFEAVDNELKEQEKEDIEAGNTDVGLESEKSAVEETKECVSLLVSHLEEFDEHSTVFGLTMNNAMLYSIYSYIGGIIIMVFSTWWG